MAGLEQGFVTGAGDLISVSDRSKAWQWRFARSSGGSVGQGRAPAGSAGCSSRAARRSLGLVVVVVGQDLVAGGRPVLAHHDYRRLDASKTGEHQVQRAIGIRVECPMMQQVLEHDGIDHHPDHDHPEKDEDEWSGAPEARDLVGDAFPEVSLIVSLLQSGMTVQLRMAPGEPTAVRTAVRPTRNGAGGAHGHRRCLSRVSGGSSVDLPGALRVGLSWPAHCVPRYSLKVMDRPARPWLATAERPGGDGSWLVLCHRPWLRKARSVPARMGTEFPVGLREP